MAETQTLQARVRDTAGSTLTQLRREGYIPAVIYGEGIEPTNISVPEKAFTGEAALHKTLVELDVNGQKINAMVHVLQRHPVSKKILHIDFYKVRLDQPIDTKIPVHVHGTEAVEKRRGIVQQQLREVEVHALPNATPEYLTVDVSNLDAGQHITVSDMELPAGVTLKSEGTEVVVAVLASKRVAETPEDEGTADTEAAAD